MHQGAAGDFLERDRDGGGTRRKLGVTVPAPGEDNPLAGLDLGERSRRGVARRDRPPVLAADAQVDPSGDVCQRRKRSGWVINSKAASGVMGSRTVFSKAIYDSPCVSGAPRPPASATRRSSSFVQNASMSAFSLAMPPCSRE